MKVTVDAALCNGHGECVVEAPEIFDLPDDAETAVILHPDSPDSLRPKATRAAALCPVAAISIKD